MMKVVKVLLVMVTMGISSFSEANVGRNILDAVENIGSAAREPLFRVAEESVGNSEWLVILAILIIAVAAGAVTAYLRNQK